MDYWKDCIAEAFEDAGIVATAEQLSTVVAWVEGAHENYSMAHGYDCIPNPLVAEIEKLKRDLRNERNKVACPHCSGRGNIVCHDSGSGRSSDSECGLCRGEGRVLP